MKGVARKGDKLSKGGEIVSASGDVQSDGIAVARVGDTVNCKVHGVKKIAGGASTVASNQKATARIGDKTTCGCEIIGGSGQRLIGDDPGSVSSEDVPAPSAAFTKPPDTPVKLAPQTEQKNAVAHVVYLNNPQRFSNPVAAENGVKQNYAGTPDTEGMVDPEPPKKCSDGHEATVVPFLKKILAEANNGVWRETGQRGKPSNPNIIGIWKSLGFPSSGIWASDQTAWCAGFVNFALKESGLPYLKEAGARNLVAKAPSIGFKSVSVSEMQPGDIVLWSFSHVNFCYTAQGGKYSFVGGNQTPQGAAKNNPDDGSVTNSWPSGWTPSRGGIVAVVRPQCK